MSRIDKMLCRYDEAAIMTTRDDNFEDKLEARATLYLLLL